LPSTTVSSSTTQRDLASALSTGYFFSDPLNETDNCRYFKQPVIRKTEKADMQLQKQ
jgi:hypothetical protein